MFSGFPCVSADKESLAMLETWVQSLGGEYPLEKEMVTHSSILAWRIPWPEEPGRLQSIGLQRVGHDLETKKQQFNVLGKFLELSSLANSEKNHFYRQH